MAKTEQFHKRMRRRLREIQRQQRSLLDSLHDGFADPMAESVGELSSVDQHTSDLGNETVERQKDLGFAARAEQVLRLCNEALERIEQGTYGVCVDCGRPIGKERLIALPFAERCVRCQEESEADGGWWKPPEEDVLSPPFGKVSYGDDGIDRDDAWEIVARHGTANTPQDTPEAFDDDDDMIEKGPYGNP